VTPSSVLTAALLLGCGIATNVGAQSAANGRTLYGFYCQACHTADPSRAITPFNLIMTAANDPAQITAASNAYSSQMGFINSILGMDAHRTDLQRASSARERDQSGLPILYTAGLRRLAFLFGIADGVRGGTGEVPRIRV